MTHTLKLNLISVLAALVLSACNAPITENTHSDHSDHEAEESHSGHDNHADDDHDDHDDHEISESDVVSLSSDEARAAGITIAQAQRGALGQSLSLPAEIRFDTDRIANLSPRVSGVIEKLYANEGDQVRRGATLARIKSRELAGLKAAWQKAETQKQLAAQSLAREEKLWADKITSQADLQAARANFEAAKAASDAAENELHAAGVSHNALKNIASAADGDNANAYLTAPISGTIVRRTITLGETVAAGDTSAAPLFTIVDDSVLWADIAVYKQDIDQISAGTAVTLKNNQGDILARSTVTMVLPVIDETSRTATARVIVENANRRLRPGQFVSAEIDMNTGTDRLHVPSASIVTVEGRPSLFVPIENGFKPRLISAGPAIEGRTVILSGLSEGEDYVSEGAFTLKAQLEKDAFGDGHDH